MSQRDQELRALVAFSHVPGIGPARLAALRAHFGSAAAAWRAPAASLGAVLDRRSLAALESTRSSLDLEAVERRLVALGARTLAVDDSDYPAALRSISNPPYILYCRGDLGVLSRPCVAIVGARRASPYGLMAAQHLASDLSAAGVTIVSGLALGIDAQAHRSALKADGATAAVLGCGLDVVYPRQNQALQRTIGERGLLITAFPPGTPPAAGNFPARNRIISGLCQATVVVEAGSRSGAMITAQCAAEQGREVFAVPGSIFAAGSEGTHELLAAGAGLARSAEDILTALGLEPPRVGKPGQKDVTLSAREAAVIERLHVESLQIDEISRQTGLKAAEVAEVLSLLELRGMVRHVGGMRWMVVQ